ncbi:MAG: hypothetical protein HQ582_27055, partial [Planctomycetes bacterium]|nr:hypothetical protein [Planctomycetota bacterium]
MAARMFGSLSRLRTMTVGLPVLLGLTAAVILADEAVAGDAPVNKPGISQKEVYSCDFKTGLPGEWKTIGGTWQRNDGCLQQTDPRPADPTKVILVVGDNRDDASRDVSILAKLRLDSTRGGDWHRAGVSVCSDPTTAHGLNLVLHGGRLQYVHDYVVWGPYVDLPFPVGTWYWIKLSKRDGQLKGKAWPDTDPEPAEWMVRWEIPNPAVTGYPALVAGADGPGKDTCPVSFAQCAVLIGDVPIRYYRKEPTWRETMVASREALARQGAAPAAEAPEQAGNSLLRTGLWGLLRRDFSDPVQRRQMAVEQQDEIWHQDWPVGRVDALAQRYVQATRAGLTQRANQLAKVARTAADLEPISKLYHRSKEIEGVLGRWKDSNLQSLRLAVEDLIHTYGSRYAGGPLYLERITEIEKTMADAPGTSGGAVDFERLYAAVAQFETLRTEALLANPMLDFDRLLVVKRKDARAYTPLPRFPIPPFSTGPGHLLNGLPLNYQGNGVLRQVPIDNEIAVLSPVQRKGRLTTLFRPEKPGYVGDVRLHFNADRMLFSSIGSHDRFQIFEVGVDGKNLRQVTPGKENDVDNYDSCYLADGRVLYGSSACFQSVPCQRRYDEVSNLCMINSDGSGIRRLCFDQDHDFYPTMLSDGRVLYTRWEYTDIAHAFSARLFTMNPDGTEQRAYYASSSFWPNRIFYAKPIPHHPTKFVGIVTGHHGTARAGEMVLFDVARGRRQAEGAVQRIPGWGKKVEAILEDHLVDASWPKFLHPCPLSDKYFLVSCRPTSQSRWGVYLVDV